MIPREESKRNIMDLNHEQIEMPKPELLKLKEEEEGLELDPNNSDKNTKMLNK